jgi:transposase
VGLLTVSAFLAAVGDPKMFRNGRELSAWLGLVPRQNTTGGNIRLGRITKRGDSYLRQLLVHGGRSVLITAKRRPEETAFAKKINRISNERGSMKAAVAAANRNARVMLAILKTKQEYRVV